MAFGIDFDFSQSEPERVAMMTPEQQRLMKALSKRTKAGLSGEVPAYPKEMYVPRTPEEEAYFAATPGIAEGIATARGELGEPAYTISPETTQQYYEEAIRAPAMEEWEETTLPLIKEAYVGPGYWGSERAEAVARGGERLATELGRQRAELYYQDELARRQAAEAAADRQAQYYTTFAGAEAETLGTAGQYARMIEQERVLSDLQRWLMGETVEGVTPTQYNPYIQQAFQLLGLQPYALGTSQIAFGGGITGGQQA